MISELSDYYLIVCPPLAQPKIYAILLPLTFGLKCCEYDISSDRTLSDKEEEIERQHLGRTDQREKTIDRKLEREKEERERNGERGGEIEGCYCWMERETKKAIERHSAGIRE